MDTTPDLSQLSNVLAVITAVLMFLATHVSVGYVRQTRREVRRPRIVFFSMVAAVSYGLGVWAASVLALAGQSIAFDLGFRAVVFVGTALVAIAITTAPIALLVFRITPVTVLIAGAMLGLAPLVAQVLMVLASGLEPGVHWRIDVVALATAVLASGGLVGLALIFLVEEDSGRSRLHWRWLGSAVVAAAVLFGQGLVVRAIDISSQIGSVYAHQVPAAAAALLAGALMPLGLLIMAFDLRLRRSAPRGGPTLVDPRGKRRRIRRGRTL